MSGESSEQPKKRGRPSHSPTDSQKKNKSKTDRRTRQEIRVRAFCFQHLLRLHSIQSMSGESPKQPPKRGRPSCHLPTDNPKKSKRITDKKARQENRAIVVELTEAAPRLTQLLESVRSINGGDLQQTLRYIQVST
ncbi:hypothetical protein Goklo_025302, partial [Gossypium klotzschianum]|nr:hypothetical protein [Gossypium klotzschianum]